MFEKNDGILRVSLNRPEALNAINSDLLEELELGIEKYIEDDTVKVLMLFGRGGCFASGADIKRLVNFDEKGIRQFHCLRERTFSLLEKFPYPTIAVIEKFALGAGLELALCCDFRISSEDALLGIPSAKLGITESYEYIGRLVRAVGPAYAKKMLITGEKVDAKTAFAVGLVEEIVPNDYLFERVNSLLADISNNSPHSMMQSKKVVETCYRDPNLFYVNDTALPMAESFNRKDVKEGTRAFIEKRKAIFK